MECPEVGPLLSTWIYYSPPAGLVFLLSCLVDLHCLLYYRCHPLTATIILPLSLYYPNPTTTLASCKLFTPFIMTTKNPLYTPTARYTSLSPPNSTSTPGETSPLLDPGCTPGRTSSKRWRSVPSSFLDANIGLFFVATAECFVSAMNMTVKLINSSDEPVPILEVRYVPPNGYCYLC